MRAAPPDSGVLEAAELAARAELSPSPSPGPDPLSLAPARVILPEPHVSPEVAAAVAAALGRVVVWDLQPVAPKAGRPGGFGDFIARAIEAGEATRATVPAAFAESWAAPHTPSSPSLGRPDASAELAQETAGQPSRRRAGSGGVAGRYHGSRALQALVGAVLGVLLGLVFEPTTGLVAAGAFVLGVLLRVRG